VAIAATIGGISVAIVATLAVLAEERLMVAAWVVAALALMGVFLGALALRKKD
jgi:hypothetical protein